MMFRIMSEPPQQEGVAAEDQEEHGAQGQIDQVVQGLDPPLSMRPAL
jgi:hypothetical protein